MPISFRDTMDAAPISRLQWLVAVVLTYILFLEGIDFQIAAYSAPALLKLWRLTKPEFAPLLAAAMVGMAIGTLIGSWTGDRYGRKWTLVVSVTFFGAMTMVCAKAGGPSSFMIIRFVSGLGLGAAFPVATAMMSEWMPRRASDKAVSIMTVGVPAGVIIGAAVGSWVLTSMDWRAFFLGVGTVCFVSGLLLIWLLPESPSFLILKGRNDDAHALLSRAWKRPIGDGREAFQLAPREALPTGREAPSAGLFGHANLRVNLGLWIGYLCSSLATYTFAAWLTVVLVKFQLPLATALRGPMTYSLSAIVGALTVGWLIDRLGSRLTMLALASLSIAGAIVMSIAVFRLAPGPQLFGILFPGLVVEGFTIGALIPTNLVVGARAYQTAIRARGIGVIYAIGRAGAILSSFLGGAVLASAHEGGFFALIAVLTFIAACGALIVNRHIAPGTETSRRRVG